MLMRPAAVADQGTPNPVTEPMPAQKGAMLPEHTKSSKSVSSLSSSVTDVLSHGLPPDLYRHKGHRNLAIRGCCAWSQMAISLSVLGDKEQMVPVALLQFLSGVTLWVQWRTGNPYMFVCRATCSWFMAITLVHSVVCGRTWPWEDLACDYYAWNDMRLPIRFVFILQVLRQIANGTSLSLQFAYPHTMLWGHGNAQLFWRGFIHAIGLVLDVSKYLLKRLHLEGSDWERSTHEELSDWLRFVVHLIASWSLLSQWWHTGEGNTGHPVSDAYEKLRREGSDIKPALGRMHQLARELVAAEQKLAQEALTFGHLASEVAIDFVHTASEKVGKAKGDVGQKLAEVLGYIPAVDDCRIPTEETIQEGECVVAEEDLGEVRAKEVQVTPRITTGSPLSPRWEMTPQVVVAPGESTREETDSVTWV